MRETDETPHFAAIDIDHVMQPYADIGDGAHAHFAIIVALVPPMDGRILLDVRGLSQRNAVFDGVQRIFERIESDHHWIYCIHK